MTIASELEVRVTSFGDVVERTEVLVVAGELFRCSFFDESGVKILTVLVHPKLNYIGEDLVFIV